LFFRGLAAALALVFAAAGTSFPLGVRYERPLVTGFHPLDDATGETSPLIAEHPVALNLHTTLFTDTTVIDFEKRQISFARFDQLGFIIWNYHYDELGGYLSDRRNFAVNQSWRQNSLLSKSGAGGGASESLKLAWELPVQYPGWAQRVLGNDPPRLSVNGSIRIKIGFEDMSRKNPGVEEVQRGGTGFVFDQSNQFTISGSVGRLININISANSEGDMDMNNPLKNFKIEYKEQKQGELEDEIVQEVIAGYTGFSMPGTQLSGYSESKEGLFGIKVASKFGPLMITTIASSEQGESQKLTADNSSKGGAASSFVQKEGDFIKYRYFFLDTAYITAWNRKYATSGGNLNAPAPPKVTKLDVWLQIDNYNEKEITERYGSENLATFAIDDSARHKFARLIPDRHYKLYETEGYIKLYDSANVREPDILAINLETEDPSLNKGTVDSMLYVVKPSTPYDNIADDPARFRLMWRNVYQLSGDLADITKFRLKLYHKDKDGGDSVETVENVLLSEILGLTDKNGEPLNKQEIFNFSDRELVFPPYNTTSTGNEPFTNPRLEHLSDTTIYRFGPQSKMMTDNYKGLFSIETSGSSKQTKWDLGFGIMESTVRVKADGAVLQPNIDYILSAEIGTLEIISPKALAAQKIEIDYQRDALFMPERKLFLGTRAEMALPFISDNSLMGLSILYQNSDVSQRVPRINMEPYSKLLLDFNTKIDLEPSWMTAAVNMLPLVKTDAKSSAKVEFEIAHNRMNPNSSKEAYVDDFESVKQTMMVYETYANWFSASPPNGIRDSLSDRPPAWDHYWFSPVSSDKQNRVLRDSIWKRDLDDPFYTGTDAYESVLRWHVQPAPKSAELSGRYKKAWAGIMQSIPVGQSDRKRDQYFELVLKTRNNGIGNGKLRVQIGRMREDVCIGGAPPNNRVNKEDTARFWREYNVTELDKGLDTLWDEDERYWIPDGSGGFESLAYNDERLEQFKTDPSKDNYLLYDYYNAGNYRYACRLEKNGISTNSEDIDANGTVETSLAEAYHEFVIDLSDPSSPFIDTTADKLKTSNGWRRYRLQLRNLYADHPGLRSDVRIDADDWKIMRMVRLIWDDFDSTTQTSEDSLMLTGMQFVGNKWESIKNDSGISKMDVSVIGTKESEEYKLSIIPYERTLIKRDLNETGRGSQPEQSLRLVFNDLAAGETALAEQSFSNLPLKIASYDSLTLMVYGRGPSPIQGQPLYNGDIRLVFRFGSDSTTYYEYSRLLMPGWDNHVRISLKDLSRLKLDYLTLHPNDSIDHWSNDGTLHIRAPKGRQPNFANVTWMAVGVVYDRSSGAPVTGELWVNELKVVGIKQFNGWSSRLNLNTQFADFLNVTGGLNYEGGDFKTMTDQDITRTGDSKLSGNFSVSTGIDKFMPREWGVSLPIGASVTTSLTRPQLRPNSDVYLTTDNKPDGFLDMSRDLVNNATGSESLPSDSTLAEQFETQTYGQSFFITYAKNSTNPNPAVDLLLERLSTNFQYNMNTNLVNRGLKPDSSGYFSNTDTSYTYSGGVKYNLTPKDPPKWTRWKPFGENPAAWVPSRFKNLEFSLLPNRANLDLANATYATTLEHRREPELTSDKESRVFDITHGLQLDFTPIRPLMDITYSLNISRKFPNSSNLSNAGEVGDFFRSDLLNRHDDPTWRKYYILNRERSRTQKLKLGLNPQFVDWLTNSADYSAEYTGALSTFGNDSTTDYFNGKVATNVGFNSSLNISSLLPAAPDSGKMGIRARMRKGCDYIGFSSVNFTYSNNANLTNNYLGSDYLLSSGEYKRPVSSADFLAYQLGLQGRTPGQFFMGDMDDRRAIGGMVSRQEYDNPNFYRDDSRAVTQSYQVSTSLSLAKPIDLRLNSISLRWNRQFNVKPDTAQFDTTRTFPEFGLGAQTSILDKVKLVNRYVQGASLQSNFSMRRNVKHNNGLGKEHGRSFEMSPLVSIDGTVKKWPIRFSYQHTMGQEERQLSKLDGSKGDEITTIRDGDNLTMTYEIQPSSSFSTIKLLKWTVPIKGRTSMGLRFTREHSVSITANETSADRSNLSVIPNISYVVTDNVTGTLEFSGSRNAENGAITSANTLALITEIRF
jgi:hypothetical protein